MAKLEISKLNVEMTIEEVRNIRVLIDKFNNNELNSKVDGSVFAVQIEQLDEDLKAVEKYYKR
jgi:hypothetical protein